MTLVEFALVAPTAFLLLLGLIIVAILVSTQVSLTNGARDAARAAAICGSDTTTSGAPPSGYSSKSSTTTSLPNGNLCTYSNVAAYVNSRLPSGCPSSACTVTIAVVDSSGTVKGGGASLDAQYLSDACNPGGVQTGNLVFGSDTKVPYVVQISATYKQQLFAPFVGILLGNSGSTSTRTLTSSATATCEQ